MSGQHGITKEYFDFASDLMDELHDAIALINGAHVDCLDDIELELDNQADDHRVRVLIDFLATALTPTVPAAG